MVTTKSYSRHTYIKESEQITMKNHQLTKVKKKTMKRQNNQKAKNKMAVVNLYLSIISLNVNGWNLSIKRHRLDRLKKKKDNYMLFTGDLFQL